MLVFVSSGASQSSLIDTENATFPSIRYVDDGGDTYFCNGDCTSLSPMATGYNTGSPGFWSVSSVPEPAAWALMFAGILGLGAVLRGKRALIA